jgi:hypothetical protein
VLALSVNVYGRLAPETNDCGMSCAPLRLRRCLPARAAKAGLRHGVYSISSMRAKLQRTQFVSLCSRPSAFSKIPTAWALMVHGGTYQAPELAEAA